MLKIKIDALDTTEFSTIQELSDFLNKCRDAYYNHDKMIISDEDYDKLFDKLEYLEKSIGIRNIESPTQSVGYSPDCTSSGLKPVKHDHPMLSLNKTKDTNDLIKFCGDKECNIGLKMDGLTCTLHYDESGNLVKAETRGDGEIGEDVLQNVLCIRNVPKHIENGGIPYTIDGEVIIKYDDFNKVNENLQEKYKHPRNLASGSLRQLDPEVTRRRNLTFVAWKVIDGDDSDSVTMRLINASDKGFEVVPYRIVNPSSSLVNPLNDMETHIEVLREIEAKQHNYPIDGLVITYDSVSYGNDLGMTSHHPRHSLAYKFYNEKHETVLRDIEWRTTRTGMIAPVAVFDPVDLGGAITTRATLHNISVMKSLELGIGDTITVYRANDVIPKIADNLTRSNTYVIPDICPDCGGRAVVRKDGDSEFLYCENDNCPSKLLMKFVHFCSKSAFDIDGLSEQTLDKFIKLGIINTYKDIFHLKDHKREITLLDGFGEKSFDNLCGAIEKSRKVKLENYLVALGIKGVGESAAKALSNQFYHSFEEFNTALKNRYDLTSIPDFGRTTSDFIYDWYDNQCNRGIELGLWSEIEFDEEIEESVTNDFIDGKTFVVTGAFNTMKRSDLEKMITSMGGKLTGSVSKKTDYLLTNETAGTTKYNKAMELGIPVMSEEEFLKKVDNT